MPRSGYGRKVNATGPVEIGALGVGSWQLNVGRRELRLRAGGVRQRIRRGTAGTADADQSVEVDGSDVIDGAIFLRPAHRIETVDVSDSAEVDAAVTPTFEGAGMFGLIAQVAPRDPPTR